MKQTKRSTISKSEAAMKWLKEEYGIKSEAELDKALAKTRLDIGIFVSPLPAKAFQHPEEPINKTSNTEIP